MPRNIRAVINWFFKWGEHAKFATEIGKFLVDYFGLWKMFASIETGLLVLVARWQEASPFWFGAAVFAVTLVVINAVWSLYNKWQTRPNIDVRDVDRRALIAEARDLVGRLIRQYPDSAQFEKQLASDPIFYRLRPYFSEHFKMILRGRMVTYPSWENSQIPAMASRFIDEIERIEKEWNLA